MTLDIFCGQSVGTLQSLDFEPPLLQAMDESVNYIMLMKHFPILQTLMQRCPPWLAKVLSPKASGMVDFREVRSLGSPGLVDNV
jgi:hypothetical protein